MFFFFATIRENIEITKKQTKQSMESAKALLLDKTIQSKEERDRYKETPVQITLLADSELLLMFRSFGIK